MEKLYSDSSFELSKLSIGSLSIEPTNQGRRPTCLAFVGLGLGLIFALFHSYNVTQEGPQPHVSTSIEHATDNLMISKFIMDASKIANNLVKSVSTGEMVRLGSLWENQICLIHFLRRFG